MATITLNWNDITAQVLKVEPKAAPALAVISQYWGDGKLTAETAQRFVNSYCSGNYVEAKRLLYGQSTAQQILDADKAENDALATMIANDKKLYDFLNAFEAALLKIALGVCLAALGF